MGYDFCAVFWSCMLEGSTIEMLQQSQEQTVFVRITAADADKLSFLGKWQWQNAQRLKAYSTACVVYSSVNLSPAEHF